jgi:D-alanyl-D-alanine carboxypeptidase/D-alanyl-D-alanine-endopeptidase (penicillin-binding protein 4)
VISRWTPVVLVLAIFCGAAAAYHYDLGQRWFGNGPTTPTAAPPPPGLTLPTAGTPRPVARPAPSGATHAAAIRRALAAPLADPHLAHVRAVVAPLHGAPLLDHGRGLSMPASTMKLLTTTAALSVLGPDHTFATRVMADGPRSITLVGGGDPLLASNRVGAGTYPHRASLQDLARLTAQRLRARHVQRVKLAYDTSLFTGPRVNPHWPKTYISEAVVSPITSLWADEGVPAGGRGRVADPAAAAAADFASYLGKDGIAVAGPQRDHPARTGARELARVTSAPLGQLVERILQTSDNEGAEVLSHQVGVAVSGQGSFTGGVDGVTQTLTQLGIDLHGARLYDGSGLSRDDRVSAATLVQVLQYDAASAHPDERAVVTGLPVAAFNGSLSSRFDRTAGAGWVRAKTGTLSGTSALAGIAADARGRLLVFAFVSNHVPVVGTLDARAALDGLAAALAACPC